MKVYLHFEEPAAESERMTIKLTLPKSWIRGATSQLIDTFVEAYNKKHPDTVLETSKVHLALKGARGPVASDATVGSVFTTQDDIYIRTGPSKTMEELGITPAPAKESVPAAPGTASSSGSGVSKRPAASRKAAAAAAPSKDPSLLVCKHFGCSQRYKEEDNHDTHCRYHEKPPIFHETRKYWSCCPTKIAYDWENFMEIPGCKVGRCTDVDPSQKFLGGSDVRAKTQADYEYAPKRLDAAAGAAGGKEKKEATGLEKLMKLRSVLLGVGVTGAAFDSARNASKARHEALGAKVWDKVCEEIASSVMASLEKMAATEGSEA